MKHRCLVFDLDGTLAPIGRAASARCAKMLADFEAHGHVVILCSGKPTFYLNGFARQLGLRAPVLIGENGGMIESGAGLPPEFSFTLPVREEKKEALSRLKAGIEKRFGDRVWFQPNLTALTPFFKDKETADGIDAFLRENASLLSGLQVYRQYDCFDVLPQEISKQAGLAYFCGKNGFFRKDLIAVGDGVNDVPMFAFADLSVCIGNAYADKAFTWFESVEEALSWILREETE